MFFNYSNIIDPFLRRLRTKVLSFSLIEKDTKILDVCCGTGNQCLYFSQKSNFVFGIDLDESMIKLSKRNKKINLRVADAQKIPFKENYFDLVSISLALHEKDAELRNKIISEIKRVTKRKGIIIIADYSSPLPNNPFSFIIKTVERIAGENHFRCFNEYILSGGIDKILKDNNLSFDKEEFIYFNTIRIIRIRKN